MEELFKQIFTTSEPTNTNLVMPAWLDITAILVGAAFGALSAKEHKLDLLGSVAMGILCGLGGGLIRDIILQRGGVYMITSPIAIPLCLVATLAVFFFSSLVLKIRPLLPWIDILSVVLFAASGTEKAVLYSVSIFGSVMLGTMSGVGGGMLRDMVLGEIPGIFRRGNFYALCAVVSSLNYYICVHLGMLKEAACVCCAIIGVGLWWLSKKFNWQSPTAVDLTPKVLKPVKKIVKATPVVREVANAVVTVGENINQGLEHSIQPAASVVEAEQAREGLPPSTSEDATPVLVPDERTMGTGQEENAPAHVVELEKPPMRVSLRASGKDSGRTGDISGTQDHEKALSEAQTLADQATGSAQAAEAAQTLRAARVFRTEESPHRSGERSWHVRRDN